MKKIMLLSVLVLAGIIYSCNKEPKSNSPTGTVYLDLPEHVAPYFDSGITQKNYEATIGRVLFYDTHLSANNSVSCASCHKQAFAFADNVAFSRGFENKLTKRNSMPIENISDNSKGFPQGPFAASLLFWDGRESNLKNLIERPISNHVEMGIADLNTLPEKLSALSYYQNLFTQTYGTPEITEDKITEALTAFVSSIQSNHSRFDDYLNSEGQLNGIELQGMNLFNQKYNCNSCHNIFPGAYASQEFIDIGLDNNYTDIGRGAISGQNFNGTFRTPNLRNVVLTAPYMHDGRFQTLDEVLEHYSKNIDNSPNLDFRLRDSMTAGPRHMNISPQEKQALIAFLNTLTDYSITTDQKFSNPFKLK